MTGADPKILKMEVLYDGHHGWPTMKILGFRWSDKAKMETASFWRNISTTIFKLPQFLYTLKACR